jgi:deoxyribose-phosphate aldolase
MSDAEPLNADLACFIDHTLLKADATDEDIAQLCAEARQYGFATVCVNSSQVALAARLLEGAATRPIAVVGFPLGAMASASKAFDAGEAVREGAAEIDMVLNIGALRGKHYALVFEDIARVVAAASPAPVKVILETSQLTADEKIVGCVLAKAAGAAFVKTSTGFAGGGATVADVELMRRIVGADMGVKASGGIRTTEDARRMLAAGASRLGVSASVAIVTGSASVASGRY